MALTVDFGTSIRTHIAAADEDTYTSPLPLLEKLCAGPRFRDISAGFGDTTGQKLGHKIKRAKIGIPENYDIFSRLTF